MGVKFLKCPCGRRLKADGLAPGTRGRCPSCGGSVRVPDAEPARPLAPAGGEDDEWSWQGSYDLGEAVRPLALRPSEPSPALKPEERWPDDFDVPDAPVTAPPEETGNGDDEWNWQGTNYDLGAGFSPPVPSPDEARRTIEDEGPAPVPAPKGWTTKADGRETKPREPESWFPPHFFYPCRGAEGVAMVISPGLAFWVMATLVPSYCLAIQADAEMLGTPLMGYLVALISAVPTLILMPMVFLYWLRYLGRVLTASFEGENLPPRPPDRNFDGLFDGLGSWLLWLVLGLGVGFLPLGAYVLAATEGILPWKPEATLVAGFLGFPYALMALLIIFLHDDPLDAKPGGVLSGIGRHLLSFLGLCLTTATLLGLTTGAFAVAFLLRSRSVWLFIGVSLAGWLLVAWIAIVTMHMFGSYYGRHRRKSGPGPRE